MTIDTLEYVKELEAAGVDRKAAEAHAQALRKAIRDELVTRAHFDAHMVTLGGKLTALEMRLIKYMVAQTVGTVGLILAVGGALARAFLR